MHAEVRLGGMELFCGGPESLQIQDREQILEVAELGPFIHSAPVPKERRLRVD